MFLTKHIGPLAPFVAGSVVSSFPVEDFAVLVQALHAGRADPHSGQVHSGHSAPPQLGRHTGRCDRRHEEQQNKGPVATARVNVLRY